MIVIGSTNLSSSLEAVAPVGSVAWLIPPPEADASDQEKRKAASVTVPNVQVYCENTRNKDVVGIITQSAPRRKDKSIVEATNLGVCVSGIATTQMDDSGNFVPGTRLEVHLPPNQYLDIEQHRNSKWSSLRLKRVSRRKNNGGRLCFRSLGIRKRQQGQVMVALCSMSRGPKDVETDVLESVLEAQSEKEVANLSVRSFQLIKYFRQLRGWPKRFYDSFIADFMNELPFGLTSWQAESRDGSAPSVQDIIDEIGGELPRLTTFAKTQRDYASLVSLLEEAKTETQKQGISKRIQATLNELVAAILVIFRGGKGSRVETDGQDIGSFLIFQLLNDTYDLQPVFLAVAEDALSDEWKSQPQRKPSLFEFSLQHTDHENKNWVLGYNATYLYCVYCVRFLYDWYTRHQSEQSSELYTVEQISHCINTFILAIPTLAVLEMKLHGGYESGSDDQNEGLVDGDDKSSSDDEGPQVDSDDRSSVPSSDVSDSDSDSAPSLEG